MGSYVRIAVRATVASVLLVAGLSLLAAAAALTSLVLGWAGHHPAVGEAAAWVLGTVGTLIVLYGLVRAWAAIYRRLG